MPGESQQAQKSRSYVLKSDPVLSPGHQTCGGALTVGTVMHPARRNQPLHYSSCCFPNHHPPTDWKYVVLGGKWYFCGDT